MSYVCLQFETRLNKVGQGDSHLLAPLTLLSLPCYLNAATAILLPCPTPLLTCAHMPA